MKKLNLKTAAKESFAPPQRETQVSPETPNTEKALDRLRTNPGGGVSGAVEGEISAPKPNYRSNDSLHMLPGRPVGVWQEPTHAACE